MKKIDTLPFREAVQDYHFLLCKGYPEKASLNLIAGHYSLSREQRIILYRGIADSESAEKRRKKLTDSLHEAGLALDGYNVFLTITNYLYGRPLFIGNDGMLRDTGEVFGSVIHDDIFFKSIDMLFSYLCEIKISSCLIYLDKPVSRSGELSQYLKEKMVSCGLSGDAETVKSPDYLLKRIQDKIVCTSDSVIIDKTQGKICDLPRLILKSNYNTAFIDLKDCF